VQLQPGRELPPTFKYCPYRYYGKLVPFEPELCQQAWESWYEKQWEQGKAFEKALEAYNALVSTSGIYPMLNVEDTSTGLNATIAGFGKLNKESVQEILSIVYEELTKERSENLELQQRWEQIQAILGSIDFSKRMDVVEELYEAHQSNQFNEVYVRLRDTTDILGKLEELAHIILDVQDDNRIRELIHEYVIFMMKPVLEDANASSSVSQGLGWRLNSWNIVKAAVLDDGDGGGTVCEPDDITCEFYRIWNRLKDQLFWLIKLSEGLNIVPVLSEIRDLLDFLGLSEWDPEKTVLRFGLYWLLLTLDMNPSNGYDDDQQQEFMTNVGTIVEHLMDTSGQNGIDLERIILDLTAYFKWSYENDLNDQVWGTVYMMAGSIENGWQLIDVRSDVVLGEGINWWGVLLSLDKANTASGKNIFVIGIGNNCSNCDFTFGAGTAVDWVNRALQMLEQFIKEGIVNGCNTSSTLCAITIAFTKPGADIDSALTALQESEEIMKSDIPILVSWQDEDGKVWWKCFGTDEACSKIKDDASQIACSQQKRPQNCGAREWPSNEFPPGMTSSGGITTEVPPPPEDFVTESCQDASGDYKLCAEGMHHR
jgi:hypothetical protein